MMRLSYSFGLKEVLGRSLIIEKELVHTAYIKYWHGYSRWL